MNSTNSKTYDDHKLLPNLTDKINLKRSDIFVALSNLAWIIHGKILKEKKTHIETINFKYYLQHGIKNLDYVMDSILYQIFKIILNIYSNTWRKTVNPSVRIYVNKIENIILFKIKTWYYL